MARTYGLILLMAVTASGTPAMGQLLPRVPPAPEPMPEYVPPPPPPVREIKPAPEEPAAPSLVVREADGRLKVYAGSLDEAVVAAYPFDADRRARVDRAAAARRAEIDRFVAQNLDRVIAARKTAPALEDLKDFNQLFAAREVATAVQVERLLDRLVRDGAISSLQRMKMDEAIKAYETERRQDWEKATGTDVMKIAGMVGRQAYTDMTRDALASLNRQVDALAPTLAADAAGLDLKPEQRKALERMTAEMSAAGGPGTEKGRAAAAAFFFDSLDLGQEESLLRKHLPPEPDKGTPREQGRGAGGG